MRPTRMWLIIVFLLITPLLSGNPMMPETKSSPITKTGLTTAQPLMQQPLVTGTRIAPAITLPSLESFIQSIANGQDEQVVGVYVPGTVALPIVQQPGNDMNFVSREPEVITQFNAASRFNTIGLLAHNYLAGTHFYDFQLDQIVIVVYGSARLAYYRITDMEKYQALTPTSPQSDFIDLNHRENSKISAGDLFNRVYTRGDRVVFQTCIYSNGDPSWGRMFIVATPLEPGSILQQSPLRSRLLTLF